MGSVGHSDAAVFEPLSNVNLQEFGEVDRALVPDAEPWGLFLAGHEDIGVGEQIRVRIALEGANTTSCTAG